ncbi:TniQ family protein [Methyloversatilis sp. XJ19-13]|uniref:TniQ family protein n=1 Tax=Methyloversatilis sp. XJ19-13 TaxID=2963430 RepID=UPI00211CFCC1|nr:TniQ family protein [Methyloversatilis sp. XJ19-13]MCQ9376117.1 TniQ family protein [Methyloversatilis sp. XJ19-13]
MNSIANNPRSELHALQPIASGTGQVESLSSYFCRLAVSHSVSTLVLSRTIAQRFEHDVIPNFEWHQRRIAGIGDSAVTWSSALSALTAVEGLDQLTFAPWRQVIAQNGLAIANCGQFCPACLADDLADGREPYFRLTWEPTAVTVCSTHGIALTTQCPHCGKHKIRHTAPYVVPGWCAHCGGFLGDADTMATPVDPAARWRARQIGDLVAQHGQLSSTPTRESLVDSITLLIAEMDNGQSASFARRIGVAKSTINYWLKGDGTPTIDASLKIAAQTGASLTQLLTGNLAEWRRPEPEEQLVLTLSRPSPRARAVARDLDWAEIDRQLKQFLSLPTPISVRDAASRVAVEPRQLYLRCNLHTRQIGARWKKYIRQCQDEKVVVAWPYLEQACIDIWAEGKAVNLREVIARVPAPIFCSITNVLQILRDVQAHLAMHRSGDSAHDHP